MEKKKLLKLKWLLPLVFVAILTAAIMIYVIAKYAGTSDVNGEVNLQGFDVTPVVTSNYTDWDSDTGIVELTEAQYEEFTLDIEKSGNGWAYIRVSVEESWRIKNINTTSKTETVVTMTGGSLSWDVYLLENTIDSTDNFYYVDGIVTNPDTISIIAGSNTAPSPSVALGSDEELVVRLSIKVEAIQYNRLKEFWGLIGDPF